MKQTFAEAMEEFKEESKEKFFELFRSYGATEEMLEVVREKLPQMPENLYESKVENKLALLDAVGVPIDKLCEHPGFLNMPMKQFLLKCEIAILEDIFVDLKYLQTTHYKELVANFGARERGYLPKDRNIFYGYEKSTKIAKLNSHKYMERFYSTKTFLKLHDRFRDEYPDFYEIFSQFPEFRAICIHTKPKHTFAEPKEKVEKESVERCKK